MESSTMLEELAELISSGAPEEVIKVFITAYWIQVQQLHIIVASTVSFVFFLIAALFGYWHYRDTKGGVT